MTAARSRESVGPDESQQLQRFRVELSTARAAMPFIDALDEANRRRAIEELQTMLPDLASCAARAVGTAEVMSELQRAGDASSRAAVWASCWDWILGACAEAARASG